MKRSQCNSYLVPTKFVPLSDQTERTVIFLAINLRNAKKKESASKELVTLICTAQLEKKVKR